MEHSKPWTISTSYPGPYLCSCPRIRQKIMRQVLFHWWKGTFFLHAENIERFWLVARNSSAQIYQRLLAVNALLVFKRYSNPRRPVACPQSRYLKVYLKCLKSLNSSVLFVKFSFGNDQLGLSMIKLTIFDHLAIPWSSEYWRKRIFRAVHGCCILVI